HSGGEMKTDVGGDHVAFFGGRDSLWRFKDTEVLTVVSTGVRPSMSHLLPSTSSRPSNLGPKSETNQDSDCDPITATQPMAPRSSLISMMSVVSVFSWRSVWDKRSLVTALEMSSRDTSSRSPEATTSRVSP